MSDTAKPIDSAYRFQHLTEYPHTVVDQIKAIYEGSFPPYETKPFWYISNALQQGHYSVFVISQDRETTSHVVAFALLAGLRTSQAMYIEYLAVEETLRGQGIGSHMFRSMFAFFKQTTTSALVWEVDPPEQSDVNARRIQFYERLGGHLVEQSKGYGMPNYFKGSGILPLRLMWKPFRYDHAQPTNSELVTFIKDIYETEYVGKDSVRDEILANLDIG
jgi:ribosomal protein S18 acetylase RimI-like enzyme